MNFNIRMFSLELVAFLLMFSWEEVYLLDIGHILNVHKKLESYVRLMYVLCPGVREINVPFPIDVRSSDWCQCF